MLYIESVRNAYFKFKIVYLFELLCIYLFATYMKFIDFGAKDYSGSVLIEEMKVSEFFVKFLKRGKYFVRFF